MATTIQGAVISGTTSYFAWDRQTLRSRLQDELGYTGTLADAEKTKWNEAIDLAVMAVSRAFPWAYSRKVKSYDMTADQAYVQLDEDFLEILPVDSIVYEENGGADAITFRPEGEFLREYDMDYSGDDTGVPFCATLRYDRDNGRWRVYLKLVPDDAYKLRIAYRVIESEMSDDAATVPVACELHDLVLLNAKWRIARLKGRSDARTFWLEYAEQLDDFQTTLGDRGQEGDWRFHDPIR